MSKVLLNWSLLIYYTANYYIYIYSLSFLHRNIIWEEKLMGFTYFRTYRYKLVLISLKVNADMEVVSIPSTRNSDPSIQSSSTIAAL